MLFKTLNGTYKLARRIVVAVVGFSVVLVGVIMIVTPGPAIVVIPAGLAILGAEFAFARRWLAQLKEKSVEAVNGLRRKDSANSNPNSDANSDTGPDSRPKSDGGAGSGPETGPDSERSMAQKCEPDLEDQQAPQGRSSSRH